jgi:hypothetical protein
LKIYVPRDEDAQEVCFKSKLPRRLVEWMMTDSNGQRRRFEESAIHVMSGVLDCSVFTVPRILLEEGVVGIDLQDLSLEDSRAWEPGPSRPEPPINSPARTPNYTLDTTTPGTLPLAPKTAVLSVQLKDPSGDKIG